MGIHLKVIHDLVGQCVNKKKKKFLKMEIPIKKTEIGHLVTIE